jgi:hypothetical protein
MNGFYHRGLFDSRLFNDVSQEFLGTLLSNIVRDDELRLRSAKGGSGRGFTRQLAEKISQSTDMPYHVHILNGLFPALKLLEQKFIQEKWFDREASAQLLRCFIVGFTFHDINKLVKADSLNEAVEVNIVRFCERLEVESFFAQWREWIEEIKFLALGTEYRTKIHSLQKPIRHYEAFNTTFAEYCHLADSIASMDGIGSVAEFYDKLCRCRLDGKNLSTLLQVSYVEVQENIFSLLSQRLLLAAKDVILNDRKQTVLFKLRNGFVYIGAPLNESEIKKIKIDFKRDLSDVVASAQFDFQSCKLGFLESLSEEVSGDRKYHDQIISALAKIIKAGFATKGRGTGKVRPLAMTNYSKGLENTNQKPEEIHILERLLDEYELPIKVIKAVKNDGRVQDYYLSLEKEWDDLEEDDRHYLSLYALEKLKALSGKSFPEWQVWRKSFSESRRLFLQKEFHYESAGENISLPTIQDLLPKFSSATTSTVVAIVSAAERRARIERRGLDLSKYLERRFEKTASKLAPRAKTINSGELDNFAQFYLSGNFERDIESVLSLIEAVPSKDKMCLFTGRSAEIKYGAERAFGFSALNFSNRSLNTLKSKDNKVSSLFLVENDLRQKELPRGFYTKKLGSDDKDKLTRQFFLDSSKANSAIYYDLGEYFVDVLTQPMLNVMGKALSYDCQDVDGLTLVFDDYAYDFNLYGMNFNLIRDDVESNFYFIYRMLKLIERTCFRIYATSILTPYHCHNQIFVFENCMPFVKALGWSAIRIDEVRERMNEMKVLLSLSAKRLVTNVLNYAEDRRYLYTAFSTLKDEEKPNARGLLVSFVNSLREEEKEKLMSVMNNLAQIAIEMVRPKSGTTSQESWIIRDALKVIKDCHKEGRDNETTIEQIAGELRKTLKNRDYANLSMCEPFANALYTQLFVEEWNGRFPQPNRLRNWVNQFAFLYAEKGWLEYRKFKVRSLIEELQSKQQEVTEDAVIELLVQGNRNLEKHADDYREVFQAMSNETQPQTGMEATQ